MKQFSLALIFLGLIFTANATTAKVDSATRAKRLALFNGDGIYLRDSTWKLGGFVSFNASQTALYQWSPGGTNSFSFLFAANFYAKYKKKKVSWDTNLDLKYGMVANGLIRSSSLAKSNFQKNIDLIQLNTNLGYDITDHLYFSGKLGFLSQFSRTYDYSQTDTANGAFQRYTVSKFAAPAIVTLGPGFTWKPKDYFTMFFTPVEGKITFVARPDKDTAKSDITYYTGVDPTRFGLNAGTWYQAALGAELDILFQKDIVKNVNWKSHLNVFVTYVTNSYNTTMPIYNATTDTTIIVPNAIKQSTEHIPVVTWDNDIVFKVNRFLNATLSTRFVYQYNALTPVDKVHNANGTKGPDGLTDVDKAGTPILAYNRLQIFEQFALGVTVKF
jgi:Protein of unknown function (DUF3078)